MAELYCVWVEAHVHWLKLWKNFYYIYLENDARTTKRDLRNAVETPVLFVAVCGPKFTKLSLHAQKILQFASRFPYDNILFCSSDIGDQFV